MIPSTYVTLRLLQDAVQCKAKEDVLDLPAEATTNAGEEENIHSLVVYNDNYNTFEHVINTLIRTCKHDRIQAEQCTFIVHFRGKCCVKKGDYQLLKPIQESITQAGINAEVV